MKACQEKYMSYAHEPLKRLDPEVVKGAAICDLVYFMEIDLKDLPHYVMYRDFDEVHKTIARLNSYIARITEVVREGEAKLK